MNANQRARNAVGMVGAAGVAVFALSLTVSAQVKTAETVLDGQATQQVTVERGEVAWVSGNNLMVKAETGELRYFPNIAADARVAVGGKQLGVADLKPGMKLERTTITSTLPKTIRTVRTVTGYRVAGDAAELGDPHARQPDEPALLDPQGSEVRRRRQGDRRVRASAGHENLRIGDQ